MTITAGKIIDVNDVAPVKWLGEQGRFLLRSEDTGGLFSFFEVTTMPGGGPPLHLHDDHDEALFVMEGEYEVKVGERSVAATAGTVAYSPRGLAHRFRNVLDVPSRLLIVATPGGHEQFFEELSAVIAAGPPDPARFAAVAAKHHITGLEPMGPPPGAPVGPPAGVRGPVGSGRPAG
jgi:mannose-6-phosphate isomerase-like protein (cupin superfamily)